ncbi:minor capsid protein [Staphylococcus ursi]|uniref:minor capsid protein n=1 Tax=Staphylococcus sp. MI 10-1553 TaxID=1912064 RepID=UPI001EF0D3DE|nr:minor capsid protein [Staphylococcus sp. MI 10-1553]
MVKVKLTIEGIDWREAKKIVDAFDVEMFQMQAKAYVENKDFSEKANEELKRYNTTMYVNREQLLKHELGLIVTKAYAEQEKVVNHHLQDSVTRTLKHQAGILGADVHVKQSDVEAIVYSNFGKLNWSERLWNNQDELRKDVERMASHVMLRGRHPYEFVPEIRKKQKQTVANTKRLLITEAARVQTEAQKMHYLETMGDDAEYEFVAKRDEKTSKICRHYDKKVFKVKDMVPGVNAPPMHPHCRSTTVPHVGNWRDKFFKDRQGKYRVEYKEVLQKLAKEDMTEALENGKIKKELNVDKQNRHQLGHQLYEAYKKKNLQKGLPIPSFTILDNDELNALIIQKAGKGRLITSDTGEWKNKEVIDFGRVIGKDYMDGRFIETRLGTVHYSKTGTHVIPNGKDEAQ